MLSRFRKQQERKQELVEHIIQIRGARREEMCPEKSKVGAEEGAFGLCGGGTEGYGEVSDVF